MEQTQALVRRKRGPRKWSKALAGWLGRKWLQATDIVKLKGTTQSATILMASARSLGWLATERAQRYLSRSFRSFGPNNVFVCVRAFIV